MCDVILLNDSFKYMFKANEVVGVRYDGVHGDYLEISLNGTVRKSQAYFRMNPNDLKLMY